jgi:hypothetical protein
MMRATASLVMRAAVTVGDAMGELAPGLEQFVHGVWRHFLFERFTPFMDAGRKGKR